MKMQQRYKGCLDKMLNSLIKISNHYKSEAYFLIFFFQNADISYENKNFSSSPDRSGILFPASLAGKRYSGERD
jgi:hypothetical protein